MNENYLAIKGESGKTYLFSSGLESLASLERFMKEVLKGEKFYHEVFTTLGGKEMRRVSALGKHCSRLSDYALSFNPEFSYSPLLRHFYQEYERHPIRAWGDAGMMISGKIGQKEIELFDDFVKVLRDVAVKERLKAKVLDWESKWRKNKSRIEKMETELFERHARLVVVRVDFMYHKEVLSEEEVGKMVAAQNHMHSRFRGSDRQQNGSGNLICLVSFEEVQKDRQKFTEKMRSHPEIFRYLVGYAWRIEYTPRVGYHMHFVLFFDGSKVQRHEYLAEQVGHLWVQEITQGRGYYHNVNRDRDKIWEKKWVLGPIDHWDHDRRKILVEDVLSYFYKGRQRIQMLPYKGANLFGTMTLKRRATRRVGRPRSIRSSTTP